MQRVVSLSLLLLICCDAPCDDEATDAGMSDTETGTSDIIRIFVWPEHPIPTEESLDVVSEVFGMEVEVSTNWLGATTLYYTEYVSASNHAGIATSTTCSPHVVMSPTASQTVLAHEIGHTLGLAHVDIPQNLMNVNDVALNLEDVQIEKARTRAWVMEQCRP